MKYAALVTAAIATLSAVAAAPADTPASPPANPPAVAPIPVQNTEPEKFVAVTTKSGDINVHLRPISANGQKFFIGKDTSTSCPLSDCSNFANSTTIFLARANDATAELGLFITVTGGQLAFVTNEGELGYNLAHSVSSPPGSVTYPFQYTPGTNPGTTGSLTFNSKGFVACPIADQAGVFQIYATGAPNFSKPDCIGVGVTTSTYTGNPAFQYN